jgi:hypothetical protein
MVAALAGSPSSVHTGLLGGVMTCLADIAFRIGHASKLPQVRTSGVGGWVMVGGMARMFTWLPLLLLLLLLQMLCSSVYNYARVTSKSKINMSKIVNAISLHR